MSEDMIPVGLNDGMGFECKSQNPCFNECCRDLNQALTPYDILRLKRNLGMVSQDFLRAYTSRHNGPETGLPVVTFKPNPQTGHECPFVRETGCSVYKDRPGSCRLYPLARAITRDRSTGEISEYFALIQEDHCKGFCKKEGKTVAQWLSGQEVAEYNVQNDKLMELISLKNRVRPGQLDGALSDLFYLALYDLDEFRFRIFDQGLLDEFGLAPSVLDRIRENDEVLLDLGIEWIKNMLFGIELKFQG